METGLQLQTVRISGFPGIIRKSGMTELKESSALANLGSPVTMMCSSTGHNRFFYNVLNESIASFTK